MNNDYHPIFNSTAFFLDTPMVDRLSKRIELWVRNGLIGAAIYGPYRAGKTVAIKNISKKICNSLNQPIPVHRVTIPRRDINTVAMVFKTICFSLGIQHKQRATSDDMSNLIFHRLSEMAIENDTKQVVLFVDEMHRLDVKQLEAFAEIYDRLAEVEINISTFFIGNYNASQNLISRIQMDENELIRGRFFANSYNYYGVKNIDDVNRILKQYDELKYPENGDSYTQFFVKNRLGKNWKLQNISSHIWDVYSDNYKKNLGLQSWPMQYFVATIRVLLVDYLPKFGYQSEEELFQIIDESIKASGLVSNIVKVA